jgi:hypothetical protein
MPQEFNKQENFYSTNCKNVFFFFLGIDDIGASLPRIINQIVTKKFDLFRVNIPIDHCVTHYATNIQRKFAIAKTLS